MSPPSPSPTPSPSFPTIAILGGGPSGLTLGALLTQHSIPYTIFELRVVPSTSPSDPTTPLPPSGSLDLHVESGQRALQACGLFERFTQLTGECSEDMVIADRAGVRRYEDDGQDSNRPEISRAALMGLLQEAVEGGKVRWGCKVLSVEKSSGASDGKEKRGRYTITYAARAPKDEESETSNTKEIKENFDIVVGADGAWSRARSFLTSIKPHFSGVNCITLTIPDLSTRYPHLDKLVGKGTFHAGDHGKAITSQRGSAGSARIYLMLASSDENWLKASGIAALATKPTAFAERLVSEQWLFGGWGDELRELITVGCEAENQAGGEVVVRPLYMLAPGTEWEQTPGVTLMGDAAHLMTPFAGEGVNSAMLDALELGESLLPALSTCEEGVDLDVVDEKIKGFEKGMWERMEPFMVETYRNLKIMFEDENAPMKFVELMESFGPPAEGEDVA